MLLKCAQCILLQGEHAHRTSPYGHTCSPCVSTHYACPATAGAHDPYLGGIRERLIKAGVEDKVFSCLRSNMDAARAPSAISAASGAIPSRMNAVMKEFGTSGNMVGREMAIPYQSGLHDP